ncbi:MAG: class I SAM-dependent methyltransferase [Hydrogenophaga sp.]|uniref:class I SAM-dependent methyltransferase n=1 Tax=Hydrogenophaga sp. TaxID=1904254 RepID=UPI001D448E08|nr:class I SAM-dependent methyltransferase [Hydrogenophaga sp.]MBX3611674.1 class I SAM-dependent methyltransferase [Hydrogenophaga sp.]
MKAVLRSFLNRAPRLKRLLRTVRDAVLPGRSVSTHYVALQGEEATVEGQRLRNAWQDDSMPAKQRALVDVQLEQYRRGDPIDVFDVFVRSLQELPDLKPDMSLLEVGCSSGFYAEVVNIAKLPLLYEGCDYAEPFIELARLRHPDNVFSVADATALHHADASFDIVVSGCCLLHIPDYDKAVAETARVARHYTVFHRTPVVWGEPERWYRKEAYGIPTVEIHFNEPEFLALLARNGLHLLATYTLNEQRSGDGSRGSAVRTYVCRKTTP